MIEEIEGIGRPLLRAVFTTASMVHGVYRVVAVVPALFGRVNRARRGLARRPVPESRRL